MGQIIGSRLGSGPRVGGLSRRSLWRRRIRIHSPDHILPNSIRFLAWHFGCCRAFGRTRPQFEHSRSVHLEGVNLGSFVHAFAAEARGIQRLVVVQSSAGIPLAAAAGCRGVRLLFITLCCVISPHFHQFCRVWGQNTDPRAYSDQKRHDTVAGDNCHTVL